MKCFTCTFWLENTWDHTNTGKCMLPLYTRLDLRPDERVSRCQTCGPLDWCWMYLPMRDKEKLADEPSTWLRIRARKVQTNGGRVGPDSEGWEPGTSLQDSRS